MEKRIADLEKRKIIVEKQLADTHQVPRKTFAAAVADGLPPKSIFQEVVNRNATGNGKQRGNANQPNKPPTPYPRTAREVVITFANNKTLQTSEEIENRALELVNDAMQQSSLKRRPFFTARFSLASNLILTTGLYDSNEDFAEYLSNIEKVVEFVGPATGTLPAPWTKFLLYGVPTCMDLETIRRDTEAFIPGRALGQIPRWLANDENRTGKGYSTIVLAFISSEKLVDLGGKIIHSIRIANKWCSVTLHPIFHLEPLPNARTVKALVTQKPSAKPNQSVRSAQGNT
jgi:hypothetical protein